ncbi:MAG: hypothetical protein IKR34_00205 [Candidatus Gastranaerophilales bacterium]|nr:hypothetical protein [Candidatus Gastranaerophilales bacterium]
MTNRKIQKSYFIKGTIMLLGAIIAVTVFPDIVHKYFKSMHDNRFFSELEFFMLIMCGIFYVFCPRYYKYQWLVILMGYGLYFLYKHFYNVLY